MSEQKKISNTKKNYFLISGAAIIIILLIGYFCNQISDYETKISEYEDWINDYKSSINDYEEKNEELEKKLENAKPWFNLSQKEKQEIIDKQYAEQKAEEEKRKQEEKEKEEQEKAEDEARTKAAEEYLEEYSKNGYNPEEDNSDYGEYIYMTRCPYCGGKWLNDTNPNSYPGNSSYCMDCGMGLEE